MLRKKKAMKPPKSIRLLWTREFDPSHFTVIQTMKLMLQTIKVLDSVLSDKVYCIGSLHDFR